MAGLRLHVREKWRRYNERYHFFEYNNKEIGSYSVPPQDRTPHRAPPRSVARPHANSRPLRHPWLRLRSAIAAPDPEHGIDTTKGTPPLSIYYDGFVITNQRGLNLMSKTRNSFADYKEDAHNWITLASGEYYPDILPE